MSHTYSSRTDCPQHDVRVFSVDGYASGDIITTTQAVPLGNRGYLQDRRHDILRAPSGDYLTKERYFLVDHVNGSELVVYLMTTFGDSGLDKVRGEFINDASLGPRRKLYDYVKIIADHVRDDSPVHEEPLCYDKGKTPLHWTGPCRPPSKKESYVRLSSTETLTIGNVGVTLMGSLSDGSCDRLLELTARMSKAQRIGTRQSVKRRRGEYIELSPLSDVCFHLSATGMFYANCNQGSIPPPTPAFGFNLASTSLRIAGTSSKSAQARRPSVAQRPFDMPPDEFEKAEALLSTETKKRATPTSELPPGTTGVTHHMSGLRQSLSPDRSTVGRARTTQEQEGKHTSRNKARKAKSKAKEKEKEKGDAQPPQPAAVRIRDESTTVNNISIDTANGDIVGARGHNTDYHQTHQSQEPQAQQVQHSNHVPRRRHDSGNNPRRQENFRYQRHVDSYRPSY